MGSMKGKGLTREIKGGKERVREDKSRERRNGKGKRLRSSICRREETGEGRRDPWLRGGGER